MGTGVHGVNGVHVVSHVAQEPQKGKDRVIILHLREMANTVKAIALALKLVKHQDVGPQV